mmetsp:Transcript_11510/g.24253  ORF Transcript_11510/g.24253 Transcript_11510/m.24253 type:complete len:206 (-) Transcript_11510:166-783(-)
MVSVICWWSFESASVSWIGEASCHCRRRRRHRCCGCCAGPRRREEEAMVLQITPSNHDSMTLGQFHYPPRLVHVPNTPIQDHRHIQRRNYRSTCLPIGHPIVLIRAFATVNGNAVAAGILQPFGECNTVMGMFQQPHLGRQPWPRPLRVLVSVVIAHDAIHVLINGIPHGSNTIHGPIFISLDQKGTKVISRGAFLRTAQIQINS